MNSTNFISLGSPIHDESNGGKIIFLQFILIEFFPFENIIIFYYNFILSDWILMNFMSLDSSRKDESNGGKIIFLRSILTELFRFENMIIFYYNFILSDWILMNKIL